VTGITGVSGRGYRWYLAAQVVSLAGTMMNYTALFWLVLHIRYGGPAALAAVDAAACLPMLLFSRRAGTIVARHRAAQVARLTQTLLACASLAIGIPLLAGWMSIWYLVPVAFVTGCVQSVDLPARQTFLMDLVGQDELRRGTSLFATVTGLARIAGPGIAGVVIATTGETAVFFVDAASFLGVIAVLAWLSGRVGPDPTPLDQTAPEATEALPAARRFRWLLDLPREVRAAVGLALLVGGFGLQFAVTNPLMAGRVFHLGSVGFGLFGTCTAVGGIAGSYYSSRRRDPGPREFMVWAVAFGVAEGLAAVMPTPWTYDATMVVVGAATQLFAASAIVYMQQATPAAQRAHALSAFNAAFIGFVPAGAFAVAAIASAAGTRWALAGPALAVAACAAVLTYRASSPARLTKHLTGRGPDEPAQPQAQLELPNTRPPESRPAEAQAKPQPAKHPPARVPVPQSLRPSPACETRARRSPVPPGLRPSPACGTPARQSPGPAAGPGPGSPA
jgi:MFS family permease